VMPVTLFSVESTLGHAVKTAINTAAAVINRIFFMIMMILD